MAELIKAILGEYQFKYAPDGGLIGGLAGLDYEWLFGALLFLICLVFVFCMIRTLFVHWFD